MKLETAIVLANDMFQRPNGKTAHGLVRYSSRFKIAAVVDRKCAGRDAGEVLDGKNRNIPIFDSINTAVRALKASSLKCKYCIVGIATPGGRLPPVLKKEVLAAISSGLNVVNGLHQFLADDPQIAAAAKAKKVRLIDIRKPAEKPHFWNGTIFKVKAPRLAILGTDCAIGKRTTAIFLLDALKKGGVNAAMIYTGQTGWMQGIKHGVIFDAIPNDFISGEVEHAVCLCDADLKPDVILIEGQSALRNPSGPCGSEFLESAQAKGVILHHSPGRKYFHGSEEFNCEIPSVEDEIKLIAMYGAKVLAVTLNESHIVEEKLLQYRDELKKKTGLPVLLPLRGELDQAVPVIQNYIRKYTR
jgi:uncharacterized NAD-dependent epimerase/dehydratase family protein